MRDDGGLPGANAVVGRVDLLRWVPLIVVVYFLVQAVGRVAFQHNLNLDEAETAGRVGFLLGYGNSQPPLYEWIVFALKSVLGSWVLSFAIVRGVLLASTFLIYFHIGRKLLGSLAGGALLSMTLCLLPQVIWHAQISLTHTVLAVFGSAAFLATLVSLTERVTWARAGLFSLALVVLLLSKYNTAFLVIGVAVAAFSIAEMRSRLADRRVLVGVLAAIVALAPHYYWMATHIDQSTERLARLTIPDENLSSFDIPAIGLDGLVSLIVSVALTAGLLLLVWFIGLRMSRAKGVARAPLAPLGAVWLKLTGRALAVSFGLVALGILAGDVHHVHDRYLVPIVMLLPLWLVLRFPLIADPRAVRRFVMTAFAVGLVAAIMQLSMFLFGNSIYAVPYDRLAARIAETANSPFAIVARYDDATNLVTKMPNATLFDESNPPEVVIVVWRDNARGPRENRRLADERYSMVGQVERLSLEFRNLSGRSMGFNFAVLRLRGG